MPDEVFSYEPWNDFFVWKYPPFGGGGQFSHDNNAAIYWYDRDTYADKGLYKLWRDGAGGYYTVSFKGTITEDEHLEFTCRANDSWDDLSDEC